MRAPVAVATLTGLEPATSAVKGDVGKGHDEAPTVAEEVRAHLGEAD
jgi:hypothetical protein